MIPELGQLAAALALAVALVQAIVPIAGAARGDLAWMATARAAAQAQALLVAFAFGCLTYAFVNNDFSVAYVAEHSNSALPLHYRIAGVWGGHEGSLLLWALMLGVWMSAVSWFSDHLPDEMTARVLGVMGIVSAGFLAFMLFTSNPFDRQFPPAVDGGGFRSWTVLLAIIAFGLSLLGTFLVRSGVLTSVHAFAVDPRRGIFILGLFTVMIGGALVLYAWRTSRIGLGGDFAPVSRESFLLANNVLLAAAAGSVFLGTLYPLLIDALGVGKISVGPPYFEAVFVPLMAPALFLMGVGPLARWKHTSIPELAVLLRWALAVSLAVGLLLPLAFGSWHALTGFSLALAVWIVATALISLKKRPRGSRAYLGMVVAHIGVAVFVVGVTLVKTYESDRDLRMKPGDTVSLAGYLFRLDEVANVKGPNYVAARAKVSVTKSGEPITVMYPEKRLYVV